MIKVIFEDNRGLDRLLAEVDTIQEADKIMYNFLKERNFVSPYCRVCGLENKTGVLLDVGSYTEFFKYIGEGVYDYYFSLKERKEDIK